MTLKDICDKFVEEILGNESRKEKCYHICYPLSLFLEINQHPNQIVRGTFKRTDSEVGINHYWIQLDKDHEKIIDPTKCQFYPNEKCEVYNETKPKEYKDPDNNQFENEFEKWLEKYTTEGNLLNVKLAELNSFLKVTLRAAILINNDIILRKKISECTKLTEYFKAIHAILAYQLTNNVQAMAPFITQNRHGFEKLLEGLRIDLGLNCNFGQK